MDLLRNKSQYLTILLNFIMTKSLLDPDFAIKNRNREAIIHSLGPRSVLVQFLYYLAPDLFPQPDRVLLATNMDEFLNSLVLKMTDADTRMGDFAFEMMRRCARFYPLLVSRYVKSIGAILQTGNYENATAAEVTIYFISFNLIF